jgi:hypothetical protein
MADAVIEARGFLRNAERSLLNRSHEHHRFVVHSSSPCSRGKEPVEIISGSVTEISHRLWHPA